MLKMLREGQVHVYTGNGKGKTTAAMGLALRAVGQGLNVSIIQYMKGGSYTGELLAAKNHLPNIEIHQFGRPCIKEQKQMKLSGNYDFVRDDIKCGSCRLCFLNDDIQRDYVEEAFKKSLKTVMQGNSHLVILDEINCAMDLGFLNTELVMNLITNKPDNVELVLTGRNAPDEIIHLADLVTEMKPHKHYFDDKKLNARRGVEY